MTPIGMRGRNSGGSGGRNSGDSGGRSSGDSGGRNSGDSGGSRYSNSGADAQSRKAVRDVDEVNRRDKEREREIEMEMEMEMEMELDRKRGSIREREDERERRRMKERERERDRESIYGVELDKPYSSTEYSISSTIYDDDDEDKILDLEHQPLYTPSFAEPSSTSAERRSRSYHSLSHTVPTPTRTPTRSCLSSSFSSPVRYSLSSSLIRDDQLSPKETKKSPGGYTKKIIAGDEKHVSVALRAYALSVVEEEKISASVSNILRNGTDTDALNNSYSPHGVIHERDGRYGDQERKIDREKERDRGRERERERMTERERETDRNRERETQYGSSGWRTNESSPSKTFYTEDEIVEMSQTS